MIYNYKSDISDDRITEILNNSRDGDPDSTLLIHGIAMNSDDVSFVIRVLKNALLTYLQAYSLAEYLNKIEDEEDDYVMNCYGFKYNIWMEVAAPWDSKDYTHECNEFHKHITITMKFNDSVLKIIYENRYIFDLLDPLMMSDDEMINIVKDELSLIYKKVA